MSVEALRSKDAIRDLVLTYARSVDRRDFKTLRTLYHPDAIDDHGGLYSGPAAGYLDWLEQGQMKGLETTNHYVLNHLIALDPTDPTRAEGEVYAVNYHRTRAGDNAPSLDSGAMDLVTAGRYLDKYECRDGAWKFAHRKLVSDWNHLGPTTTDWTRPFEQGSYLGRDDKNDPAWEFFEVLGR